jgi:hypothetical protein
LEFAENAGKLGLATVDFKDLGDGDLKGHGFTARGKTPLRRGFERARLSSCRKAPGINAALEAAEGGFFLQQSVGD